MASTFVLPYVQGPQVPETEDSAKPYTLCFPYTYIPMVKFKL